MLPQAERAKAAATAELAGARQVAAAELADKESELEDAQREGLLARAMASGYSKDLQVCRRGGWWCCLRVRGDV
jgi:hypothetical protein